MKLGGLSWKPQQPPCQEQQPRRQVVQVGERVPSQHMTFMVAVARSGVGRESGVLSVVSARRRRSFGMAPLANPAVVVVCGESAERLSGVCTSVCAVGSTRVGCGVGGGLGRNVL